MGGLVFDHEWARIHTNEEDSLRESSSHLSLASFPGRDACASRIPLPSSLFWLQLSLMIRSFADPLTEKIFRGDALTKKEARRLGDIRIEKAQERLLILHHSAEKDLLTLHSLHYHKLHGTSRYSIDANSRASQWRITFAWADQELTDVSLVTIEDTH
jgi:plasmid maintenance system killer protein